MPSEPTWARVLDALYDHRMRGEDFDEKGYSKLARSHAIAEELGDIEPAEVHAVLRELKRYGLIHDLQSGRESKGFHLTEKGFEVAHEREIQKKRREHEEALQENRRELQEMMADEAEERGRRQHEVNRAIGFLTLGLLTVSLIQAGVAATSMSSRIEVSPGVFLAAGAAVTGVVAIIILRSGMLRPWEDSQ